MAFRVSGVLKTKGSGTHIVIEAINMNIPPSSNSVVVNRPRFLLTAWHVVCHRNNYAV